MSHAPLRSRQRLALAVIIQFAAAPAFGELLTWTGAVNSSLTLPANWSPAVAPTASSSVLFGEQGVNYSVSPGSSPVQDITFAGPNPYTFTSSVTVASGAITTLGTATHTLAGVALPSAATWNIEAPLTLTAGIQGGFTYGSLTKTGPGALTFTNGLGNATLSNVSLFGGTTRVIGGIGNYFGSQGSAGSPPLVDIRGADLELRGPLSAFFASSSNPGGRGTISLTASNSAPASMLVSGNLAVIQYWSNLIVGASAATPSTLASKITFSNRATASDFASIVVGQNATTTTDTFLADTNSDIVTTAFAVATVAGSRGDVTLRDTSTTLTATTLTLGSQTTGLTDGVGTLSVESNAALTVKGVMKFNSSASALTVNGGTATIGALSSLPGTSPLIRVANVGAAAGLRIVPDFGSSLTGTNVFTGSIIDATSAPADVEIGSSSASELVQRFDARQSYTGVTRIGGFSTVILGVEDTLSPLSAIQLNSFTTLNLGGHPQHTGPIGGASFFATISGPAGSTLFAPSINLAGLTLNVPANIAGSLSSSSRLIVNAPLSAGSINLTAGQGTFNSPLTAGAFTAASGTTVTFTGSTTIAANATLAGIVRVGPATTSFGSLTLAPTTNLQMDIAGTNPGVTYDRLAISGNLVVAGTLTVVLAPSFTPAVGNTFDLFDFTSRSGTFAALILPDLAAGLRWTLTDFYNAGILRVIALPLPGDYNADGFVDAADYTLWADAFGRTAIPNTYLPADGNLDGIIDAADYTVWADHFGQGTPPSVGAIPEPTAIALLLITATILTRRRR